MINPSTVHELAKVAHRGYQIEALGVLAFFNTYKGGTSSSEHNRLHRSGDQKYFVGSDEEGSYVAKTAQAGCPSPHP